MNELLYNFLNEIEDTHKIKEMTVEEFTKLVKTNKLISEEDGKILIDSFKKIAEKKNPQDDGNDSDQRKKKYKSEHQYEVNQYRYFQKFLIPYLRLNNLLLKQMEKS